MFILLNGSFGIGKTTVAALLAKELPGAGVYDPERIGSVLRRLPAWMLGLSTQPDDFQDLRQWRYLIARGSRRAHRLASPVIVPMAFTNRDYLETFAAALSATSTVHRFCLIAPLEVIEQRLEARAKKEGKPVGSWALRRARECVEAHWDPVFGVPIDATKAPAEIVAAIRQRLAI